MDNIFDRLGEELPKRAIAGDGRTMQYAKEWMYEVPTDNYGERLEHVYRCDPGSITDEQTALAYAYFQKDFLKTQTLANMYWKRAHDDDYPSEDFKENIGIAWKMALRAEKDLQRVQLLCPETEGFYDLALSYETLEDHVAFLKKKIYLTMAFPQDYPLAMAHQEELDLMNVELDEFIEAEDYESAALVRNQWQDYTDRMIGRMKLSTIEDVL
ncbi:hypothetical protein C4573_07130 [Candidatus Woesearchaeota archaeon]|nr:MAG: hypothetical protein C4573_07130 [Candidatus Woesearchaeota archaeon]